MYKITLVQKGKYYVGVVFSNKGLVACTTPSTNIDDWFKRITKKINASIDNSSSIGRIYAEIIYSLHESSKDSWEKALEIKIDPVLFTENEKKVINKLREVYPGNTITYKELGIKAGFPNAARFIGNTMRKNYLPLIIPCHRVIKSNGEIGNYSGGGTQLKKIYLKQEGVKIE